MRTKTIPVVIIGLAAIFVAFASHSSQQLVGPKKEVNLEDRYLSLDRSPAGLESYREEVLLLHNTVKENRIAEVHSTVTFSEPLAVEDAQDLIVRFGIEPHLTYAFATDPEGAVITIGGKFSQGIEAQLPRVVQEEGAALLGVVSVIGSVPSRHLDELQADPRVFLVDISADANLMDNPGNKQYMQHFAWDLWEQREGPLNGVKEN